MTRKLRPGDRIRPRALDGVRGEELAIPDPDRLVHLQLRRFSGCPVCNLHLQSFARRHEDIARAGVLEIAAFHSDPKELARHTADLPFPTVGDPRKRLYREFGAESSVWGLLHPRSWPTILRAIGEAAVGIARGKVKPPRLRPHGGRYALPVDLLIDTEGEIVAVKYGRRINDHWEVDDVIALAGKHAVSSPGSDQDTVW